MCHALSKIIRLKVTILINGTQKVTFTNPPSMKYSVRDKKHFQAARYRTFIIPKLKIWPATLTLSLTLVTSLDI